MRPYGTTSRGTSASGAAVAGAVGCAWIDRWDAAVKSNDSGTAQEAVDAMASSHSWQVLLDMNAEGGYPEALWGIAEAMWTGTSEVQNTAKAKTGKDISLTEVANGTLGCGR